MTDHFGSLRGAILGLATLWERYTAGWCTENIAELRTLGGSEVPLVVYEKARDDHDALEPLFTYSGVDFDKSNRFELALKMSSGTPSTRIDPEENRSTRNALKSSGLADYFAADGAVAVRQAWTRATIGEGTA